MKKILSGLVLSSVFCLISGTAKAASVTVDQHDKSVLIITDTNAVRLQPWSSGVIRIEAAPGQTIPEKKSLAVLTSPNAEDWSVTEGAEKVELKSDRLRVSADKQTGLISFFAADGTPLLEQSAWSFKPAQDSARNGLEVGASFHRALGEHFYGGGVIGGDLRGATADIRMANYATQMRVPILYSSRGYSLFWDNSGWGRLKLTQDTMTWNSSTGDLADFYIMAGPSADATISEYRDLTGAVPLFPKWAYGFWFSKNRFNSQQEILKAAKDFRDHQFPVDLIVQDYFYWKPTGAPNPWTGWGSHHFVPDRYPDPKAMIDQLHDEYHLHFMAVIWPRFDNQTDHAAELDAAHLLFPHMGTKGWDAGTSFYDAFSSQGREIYGRQVMESLLPLGVDAFWMDATQPESGGGAFSKFDSAMGPVSRLEDAYPLMDTTAVYTAERKVTDQKRVVLLPCAVWPGEQRNAAALWTSDIHQDWKTLAWQIEGLQNYSITGLPYVTTDVGGYLPTPESDRELFVRWFEWGFCPIFRVHGIARPFPWDYGTEGEAILKKFDLLHYRLLPYIYSQAANITLENGTLMRPLVMDFRSDPEALSAWDEFMFGPSLLICPVYTSTREPVGSVEDFTDLQGQSAAVTATYEKAGNGTPEHKDLKDDGGFEFKETAAGDERWADNIRIEGTYIPKQSGPLALEVSEPHAEVHPVRVSFDGNTISSQQPAGDWKFPLFPFTAQAGVPLHFTIETKMPNPAFRIVRVLTGPVHREVYLPGAGPWYDFWTGERVEGSKSLEVDTPLDMIPLYVRAGAIIPMGPEIQYAAQDRDASIEVRVYRGADGSFKLYDDEGDNYDYEKGAYAIIPISWNEASRTLTFGTRTGTYPGILPRRTFHVIWVGSGHGEGEPPTTKADAVVSYEGQPIQVQAP